MKFIFAKIKFFLKRLFRDPFKKEKKCFPRFTWLDRDQIIVDVVFKIFTEYLEKENPNWELAFDYKPTTDAEKEYWINNKLPLYQEYKEIYQFIKFRYPVLKDMFLHDEIDEEDFIKIENEYLIRIIKIRHSLWT